MAGWIGIFGGAAMHDAFAGLIVLALFVNIVASGVIDDFAFCLLFGRGSLRIIHEYLRMHDGSQL